MPRPPLPSLPPPLAAALAAFVALGIAAAAPARADRKSFAHVYPYFTQPRGGLELEWWVSAEIGDLSRASDSALFEHRLELEYGLTDRWDVSVYQVFTQGSTTPPPAGTPAAPAAFAYDSTRVETRYRFAEKGDWPVDTEVYGELERPADLAEPWELETKAILARDFGRLLVQENLIDELKLAGGERFGYRLASNGGVGVSIAPGLTVGAELLLNRERIDGRSSAQDDVWAGPSVSIGLPRGYLLFTGDFHVAGAGAPPDLGRALRFRFIYSAEL